MPRRPWYPWFPGDYLQDTLHLSLEECGAYRRLLDWSWINGPIPNSIPAIARILRVSPQKARALMKNLGGFFDLDGVVFFSRRLEKERSHYEDISLKRKEAALAKGGAKGGAKQQQLQEIPDTRSSPNGEVPLIPDGISASEDELIWKIGVGLVGGSEAVARSFLGKLVKQHGKTKVARVIGEASVNRPVEPKAYLVEALKEKKRGAVL